MNMVSGNLSVRTVKVLKFVFMINKSSRKKCNDSIKVTIQNRLHSTCNRYDADRFIGKCFLKGLIEDFEACYYEDCKIKLQLYQDDLATIQRLDNYIEHIRRTVFCVV